AVSDPFRRLAVAAVSNMLCPVVIPIGFTRQRASAGQPIQYSAQIGAAWRILQASADCGQWMFLTVELREVGSVLETQPIAWINQPSTIPVSMPFCAFTLLSAELQCSVLSRNGFFFGHSRSGHPVEFQQGLCLRMLDSGEPFQEWSGLSLQRLVSLLIEKQ